MPNSFVQEIEIIIEQARTHSVRSVEFHRVQMYWKPGEYIFNEGQQGKHWKCNIMKKVKLSEIAFIKIGQSPEGETCNQDGIGVR